MWQVARVYVAFLHGFLKIATTGNFAQYDTGLIWKDVSHGFASNMQFCDKML